MPFAEGVCDAWSLNLTQTHWMLLLVVRLQPTLAGGTTLLKISASAFSKSHDFSVLTLLSWESQKCFMLLDYEGCAYIVWSLIDHISGHGLRSWVVPGPQSGYDRW